MLRDIPAIHFAKSSIEMSHGTPGSEPLLTTLDDRTTSGNAVGREFRDAEWGRLVDQIAHIDWAGLFLRNRPDFSNLWVATLARRQPSCCQALCAGRRVFAAAIYPERMQYWQTILRRYCPPSCETWLVSPQGTPRLFRAADVPRDVVAA